MEEPNRTSTASDQEEEVAATPAPPPPLSPRVWEALDGRVVVLQMFEEYLLTTASVTGEIDLVANNQQPIPTDKLRGKLRVLKDEYSTMLQIQMSDPGAPQNTLSILIHPSVVKFMSAANSIMAVPGATPWSNHPG